MAWIKLHFVVVLCSILIVRGRIRSKMKTCEQKREVTVLFDALAKMDDGGFLEISTVEEERSNVIKTLRRHENKACFKLSIVNVRLSSPIKKNDNKFGDGDSQTSYIDDNYNDDFKEILQNYEIEQSDSKRRTLVFFSNRLLKQDVIDILYIRYFYTKTIPKTSEIHNLLPGS